MSFKSDVHLVNWIKVEVNNMYDIVLTRMCAIKHVVCMSVEFLSKDSAVVQVTGVDETLCRIFEQQVTFTILLGLKDLKFSVYVGWQSFLHSKEKHNMNMLVFTWLFHHVKKEKCIIIKMCRSSSDWCTNNSTCDFMRKSYTRAVRTGLVMTVLGGMTPRLQLSQSDSWARPPSGHSNSKSEESQPSAQPVHLKPGEHTVNLWVK